MEKQNNSETYKNVGSNEAKPPKKKMKTSTIVIIVLVVLLLFSCVGNLTGSDSSTSPTSTVEDKDTKDEVKEEKTIEPGETAEESESGEDSEKTAEETEIPEKDPNHIYVGDGFIYEGGRNDGIAIIITGAGIDLTIPAVYLNLDVVNQSEDIHEFTSSGFSIYIDDYQVDVDTASVYGYNYTDSVTVNPGKKAKFTFASKVPSSYFTADKIEIQLPGSNDDRTLLIKDNGIYVNGQIETQTTESATEELEIDIPEYEYAADDPYNPDNLYGMHTQAENPNITMEVYELYSGYYTFIITYGDGDDDFITFAPDAGELLNYWTGEPSGFYDITKAGIIINGCEIESINGTYK